MGASGPGDRSPKRRRLPRDARIRLGDDIRSLLRGGMRDRGSSLDVFLGPAPASFSRFGTIVPRYGRTVVARNLLRRRLREIGRTEILPRLREAGRSDDVLVRARSRAYEASFSDLSTELIRLTERLCSDASF